ncbi:MAG TPA: class II aldolase/adducin family protein [Bacteroidales bacterium]|jgi:L-ribulose-5-phosphate 4-epimerase|nr:class II aldolase/adducin family protein [Bacteroidales bacterium]HOG56202.1 class II aldolase/adducin family protein [Bacteroidales bacterium]HPV16061.1 class II aldolase/adducin family protein [Bacteroidales bacterium]HPX43734.1 class II aldolase/adducin family protein [Bacteroidales bacterium]HQB85953.1 class II aldolase/adducin family protein [Bacteroidales bacterium]
MEGVVKFNCHWNQSGPVISDEMYEIINYWREVLYNMDIIGAYENGVCYGNISMRIGKSNQFIITASATGEIPELEPGHYVKVNSFNIDENAVQCTGPLKASSESLTHAAIYLADQGANAVVHVHSIDLWNELIYKVPTTNPSMEYGTTGLARDIFRLFSESDVIEKRIIVMAGDREGILTFGHDMDEAVNVLMQYLRKEN